MSLVRTRHRASQAEPRRSAENRLSTGLCTGLCRFSARLAVHGQTRGRGHSSHTFSRSCSHGCRPDWSDALHRLNCGLRWFPLRRRFRMARISTGPCSSPSPGSSAGMAGQGTVRSRGLQPPPDAKGAVGLGGQAGEGVRTAFIRREAVSCVSAQFRGLGPWLITREW
jgi:hypothetical protein